MTLHTYTIPYEGEEYEVTIEDTGGDIMLSNIQSSRFFAAPYDISYRSQCYFYEEAVKRHTEPKESEGLPCGWRDETDCY